MLYKFSKFFPKRHSAENLTSELPILDTTLSRERRRGGGLSSKG